MHKFKLPLGPWSHEPNEKSWVDTVAPMSLRAALEMVLARARTNRSALTLDDECKLNDALDAVYEHIKGMED